MDLLHVQRFEAAVLRLPIPLHVRNKRVLWDARASTDSLSRFVEERARRLFCFDRAIAKHDIWMTAS